MNTMAVILTNREINSIIGTGAFRFGGHSKMDFFLAAPFLCENEEERKDTGCSTRGVSPI